MGHAPELEGLENSAPVDDDEEKDYIEYNIWGFSLLDSDNTQIHTPKIELDEVEIVSEGGVGDYETADEEDFNEMDANNEELESNSSSEVRKSVVKPTFFKLLGVEANALTVAGYVRDSKIGNFVRGGRPPVNGISNGLKVTGNVLGGIGILYTGGQYINGDITGTEASIDAIMGAVGFFGPWGAAISLTYFAGKAIYEYSSGDTLFEKPTQ